MKIDFQKLKKVIYSLQNLIKEELKTRSPYLCVCMREMWHMLQILIEDMNRLGYAKVK